MRAPSSPLDAQTVLFQATRYGDGFLTIGDDNLHFSGMADPLTQREAMMEADQHSESDSEGDIIPGPNNQRAPGAATPIAPRVEPTTADPKLHMIHASLLIQKPDGSIKWNTASEINPFIAPTSPLYKCGGPVLQVQESRSWTMDIMLCWKDSCTFCSQTFDPAGSPSDRKYAAEAEEQRNVDVSKSPYRGLPFVHSRDLSKRKGGRVFAPGASGEIVEMESTEGVRVIEVIFTVAERKMCKEAKTVAVEQGRARRVKQGTASGSKKKKKKSKGLSLPEPDEDEIVLETPSKVFPRVEAQEYGASNGADVDEQLFFDENGALLRRYSEAEPSPEQGLGRRSRKGKGKRKFME
ncbi:hypothetical protein PRZ48_003202 [Zasmidium cellare]|uniref:Uncharacterized protein n=1 Tax=Zasmidium cellare TaxID=395010 RepID=A0ABR0EUD4_ZASCE|nr:hypothetical protein PRZ48_003202 [Zasmidium cellare]